MISFKIWAGLSDEFSETRLLREVLNNMLQSKDTQKKDAYRRLSKMSHRALESIIKQVVAEPTVQADPISTRMQKLIARRPQSATSTTPTSATPASAASSSFSAPSAIPAFAASSSSSSSSAPSTASALPRASKTIAEPWRSLANQVLWRAIGSPISGPTEWPHKLEGHHDTLYKYIFKQLHKETLSKVEEKDLFVAMSGIVNARMEDSSKIFGDETIKAIKEICLLPLAHVPSDELLAILEPLKAAFEAGGLSGLLDQVDEFIGDDARNRKAKKETSMLRGNILDTIRYL
ncbi:hypothetical protein BGZ58_002993 [Dissophora ornata]|nr:hypothetical protein BGZ58_002993 [Dissophora ornata]